MVIAEWALLRTDPMPGTLLKSVHASSPLFLGQSWEVASVIPSLQMKKLRAGSHCWFQNPKTLDSPRRERLTWEGRVFGTSTSTQGFQSGGRVFAAPHYTAQTLSSKTSLHADQVCPTQEHILMAQPRWIRGHPAYR